MTAYLFIGSLFLMIILIISVTLALSLKTWVYRKDAINEKRFAELRDRIDETQDLFRTEVAEILDNVKNIINK